MCCVGRALDHTQSSFWPSSFITARRHAALQKLSLTWSLIRLAGTAPRLQAAGMHCSPCTAGMQCSTREYRI